MESRNFPAMSFDGKPGNFHSNPNQYECLCCRPRRVVICTNCGFKALGRIHYICERHPKTSYLLDWSQCPNCRGYCLNEY